MPLKEMFEELRAKVRLMHEWKVYPRFAYVYPESRGSRLVASMLRLAELMFRKANYRTISWHLVSWTRTDDLPLLKIAANWKGYRGDVGVLKKIETLWVREMQDMPLYWETNGIRFDVDRHGMSILFRDEKRMAKFIRARNIRINFDAKYEEIDHHIAVLEAETDSINGLFKILKEGKL